MKWLIVALLGIIIALGILSYYQGKKDAENARDRLETEEYILTLKGEKKAIRDSLRTSEKRYSNLEKEKQKVKIIRHEIKVNIDTISVTKLDSLMVADGFHVSVCPCR